MTIMRDVVIAKTEFKADEKAITKIQDFQVRYNDIMAQILYLYIV